MIKQIGKALAAAIAAAAMLLGAGTGRAHAADKLHVGKAINVLWIYTILDIGVDQGIFNKYGLDIEISVLPGDAKFQQALISKSIDIGLASGADIDAYRDQRLLELRI